MRAVDVINRVEQKPAGVNVDVSGPRLSESCLIGVATEDVIVEDMAAYFV